MDKVIVVVSGLPRSGTSMMMRMLEAGGIEALTDKVRSADEDNPEGYFEFEPVKKLKETHDWLERAGGKAVKVISRLLADLPSGPLYNVIFMRRDMEEVLASQQAMLVRRGMTSGRNDDAQLELLFQRHLEEVELWLKGRVGFEVLNIRYDRAIEEPMDAARGIAAFLRLDLDVEKMASVVNPNLYRQRAKKL